MPEDKITKSEAIAKTVEKVADSKGLVEIGKGLGSGLVALGGALAFASIYFGIAAMKWDGHLHPQTKCYELREINEKVYKINTCTGETELIENSNTDAKDHSK